MVSQPKLQRTRCPYYRVGRFACNRRGPGSGCAAIGGENRWHAVFGGSEHCIAVHPSDPAVALLALDAAVLTAGPSGERWPTCISCPATRRSGKLPSSTAS